jgi:hypothetical protein
MRIPREDYREPYDIVQFNDGWLISWFNGGYQGKDGYVARKPENATPFHKIADIEKARK